MQEHQRQNHEHLCPRHDANGSPAIRWSVLPLEASELELIQRKGSGIAQHTHSNLLTGLFKHILTNSLTEELVDEVINHFLHWLCCIN